MVRKIRQLNSIQFCSFSSTVSSDAVKLVAEMLKVFVEGKALHMQSFTVQCNIVSFSIMTIVCMLQRRHAEQLNRLTARTVTLLILNTLKRFFHSW